MSHHFTFEYLPGKTNIDWTEQHGPEWPLLETICFCYPAFTPLMAGAATVGIPSIVHAILVLCGSLSTLFSELLPRNRESDDIENDGDTADESTTESRRCVTLGWPLLRTLSLSAIASEDIQLLCDVIRDRISRGTTISLSFSGSGRGLPQEHAGLVTADHRISNLLDMCVRFHCYGDLSLTWRYEKTN